MQDRFTVVGLKVELSERSRLQGLERRSSGFRYWILVPFFSFILYGSAIWAAIAGAVDKVRFKRTARRVR